jgi:hypothetical protein
MDVETALVDHTFLEARKEVGSEVGEKGVEQNVGLCRVEGEG